MKAWEFLEDANHLPLGQTITSGLQVLFALCLCILAFFDVFIWRYSPADIYTGQPIVYWSHLEQATRARLFIPILGIFSVWFFLRKVFKFFNWFHWQAVSLVMIAAVFFTIIAPLAVIGQTAKHFQSLETGNHRYHIFYQYDAFGAVSCEHILVVCDNFGLLCEYRQSWELSPICLGNAAPLIITQRNNQLILTFNTETIYIFDE